MSTGLTIFTLFHVAISLVGIGSGFVVIYGFLTSQRLDGWTTPFLLTTVGTSVTGYMFPVHKLMPSHVVGALSLIVLSIAIFGRYKKHMAGSWRWIYVVTAMLGQYFNVFVLVVQSFEKVPALKALAPTQTEGPFKWAQLVVLVIFFALTMASVARFRLGPPKLGPAGAQPA